MKKRFLAFTYFLFLSFPLIAGPFININSIDSKSDFPRIRLNVSVVDPKNRGISGLDEENILVYEDGYRVNYVKVKDISSSSDPLYIIFAIDSSKSISAAYLEKIKKEASNIAEEASSADRIAVIRFNDTVQLLNNFSSNRMEIAKNIKSVSRHGSKTLMNDAIFDSVEYLSKIKSSRKGVVVFTDGKDDGSSLNSDDIIKSAKEQGVPVHFLTSASCKNPGSIGRIAKLTGGVVLSCSGNSVAGIYRSVIARMKNTYDIFYQTIVKRDNGKHLLEVRLKYGDLKDRDAAEYIAERNFFKIEFPDGSYIILSLLVLLLMLALFAFLIVFFRRSQKRLAEVKKDGRGERVVNPGIYTGEVSIDDLRREDLFDENAPREIPDVIYSQVWLQHKDDHGSGEKFQMLKNEITIGSGSDNNYSIDESSVSENHSRIRRIEGGYYLYDLISETGTYLNGKKLLRPKLLHDWDEITMGAVTLIFRAVR